MYKNREELLKELEAVRADRDEALDYANKAKERIRELDAELKELKRAESMKEACDVAASQFKIIYDSFVDAGFTDSQAFDLLTSIIPALLKPTTVQAPSVDQFIRRMLL